MHVCSSFELQPAGEMSSVTVKSSGSPDYEVIPAFSEDNNQTVISNIAYGAIQQPEAEKLVEKASEYEVPVPAFNKANNPTVPEASNQTIASNTAYGATQYKQQQHESRKEAKLISAMQKESNSLRGSGSVPQAHGIDEEDSDYMDMTNPKF